MSVVRLCICGYLMIFKELNVYAGGLFRSMVLVGITVEIYNCRLLNSRLRLSEIIFFISFYFVIGHFYFWSDMYDYLLQKKDRNNGNYVRFFPPSRIFAPKWCRVSRLIVVKAAYGSVYKNIFLGPRYKWMNQRVFNEVALYLNIILMQIVMLYALEFSTLLPADRLVC